MIDLQHAPKYDGACCNFKLKTKFIPIAFIKSSYLIY